MTSLAVNYGWTPELVAQDKALKAKYGQGAHIIPAKTYVGNLERSPEVEMFAPKKSEKKHTIAKVALIALLGALGIVVIKKNASKMKDLLGLGKKASYHAPQTVTAGEKKILDQFAKIDKFKSESKFLKDIKAPSENWVNTTYKQGAPYVKGCVNNLHNGKTATLLLNDGRSLSFKSCIDKNGNTIYRVLDDNFIFTSKYMNNADDAYAHILDCLHGTGSDGAAVVAELKRLAQLI